MLTVKECHAVNFYSTERIILVKMNRKTLIEVVFATIAAILIFLILKK